MSHDGRLGELLAVVFDRQAVTRTRHAVARCAAQAGLIGTRLEGFVLAVNEIMTNAVRHGAGHGRLKLWRVDGTVWCEVHDTGGVRSPLPLDGHRLPPPEATGGRGLWLARELCDVISVDASTAGTTVRLAIKSDPG